MWGVTLWNIERRRPSYSERRMGQIRRNGDAGGLQLLNNRIPNESGAVRVANFGQGAVQCVDKFPLGRKRQQPLIFCALIWHAKILTEAKQKYHEKSIDTRYRLSLYTSTMKRGAVTKDESRLMTVWVPEALLPLIDRGVRKLDTDRSKFVRVAIREKLLRSGIQMQEESA